MPSYQSETVDFCIVGSGAGGGPLAYELSKAGFSVVVLEKGPWYKTPDFDHDEIKNCRRNYWVPFVSDEPHVVSFKGQKRPNTTSDGWISCCVGGGTVHMSGFVYRLHPEDFRMATKYGQIEGASLADWPISYDDLAPWYDKVERVVGVSGKAGDNPFEPKRSGDYPFPPLFHNPLAQLIDEGAKKVGAHPFQTPRAIISRPKDDRAACAYCDFCGSYGCEVGAKSSTMASVIAQAVKTGKCEVRTPAMARRVETDKEGKVTGVVYFDGDKNLQRQKAKVVIVSCSSIESARLLLLSDSGRFKDGLANSSGLVGKNLSFSTLGKAYGEFERDKLPGDLRKRAEEASVHFLQRSIQDTYFLGEGRPQGYDKGGTICFLIPHKNPIFTAERISQRGQPHRLWGEALKKALYRYYRDVFEIEFETFGEFLPNPDTFVSLDPQVRDKWGTPSARIDVHNHELDRQNNLEMVKRGIALLEAAGASKAKGEKWGQTTWILQHGTCRFGSDPDKSVLDVNCKAHDVDNLYVVDGSFMPTSGGVPTTLTIMANSFRVADHLVRRFKTRGG